MCDGIKPDQTHTRIISVLVREIDEQVRNSFRTKHHVFTRVTDIRFLTCWRQNVRNYLKILHVQYCRVTFFELQLAQRSSRSTTNAN